MFCNEESVTGIVGNNAKHYRTSTQLLAIIILDVRNVYNTPSARASGWKAVQRPVIQCEVVAFRDDKTETKRIWFLLKKLVPSESSAAE